MTDTIIQPSAVNPGTILHTNGSDGNFFSTWAGIEATNRNGAMNLKATGDASVADLNAINLASVAGINATNLNGMSVTKNVTDTAVAGIKTTTDGTTSINKNVYDGVVSSLNATNLSAVATQKSISDAALASALAFGEVRNNIATESAVASMNAKDIQLAIYKDGSHTREEMQEGLCELGKDTAKGFADAALETAKNTAAIQLEAAKNKAAIELDACKNTALLASKIDDLCCCIKEDNEKTRQQISAESAARQAAQIQRQEMEILILKSKHHEGR